MTVLRALDGRYPTEGSEKDLSDKLFSIFNDEKNIGTIRQVYPAVLKNLDRLTFTQAMFARFLDEETFAANNPSNRDYTTHVVNASQKTVVADVVIGTIAALHDKKFEADVKEMEGGNALWESLRNLATEMYKAVEQSPDCPTKEHVMSHSAVSINKGKMKL